MLTRPPGVSLPERTTKSCSRCGGPLELRHLQGLEVEVCVRCGAAVLDRADLESLTANAVLSAPEARPTDAGVVQVRSPPAPARPERKKPWDFTPRPAPPRKPPRRVEKTLIPTLLEPGEDETEDGPMIVGHRIHDSEPPVRPREVVPDSEMPTGPPAPAPLPKAGPPKPPPVKAITPATPALAGPGFARAEPSLGKPSAAPPPPPSTLGRTVRPEDGNAPAVRPTAPVGAASEPGLGSMPPHAVDEPGLDLDGPEPSTEEGPFQRITRDAPPVVALDGPLPDDDQVAWEASGGRIRSMFLVASAMAAAGTVVALLALALWVTWLGPRWRERAAEVRGPDLAEVVGAPTGDVVLERPEPVVPDEILPEAPDEILSEDDPIGGPPDAPREPDEPLGAPPAPAPVPAPTTRPDPEPIDAAAPLPRPVAPRPTPAPVTVSRERLIERGWETVESNPDAALAAFGQVLETSPSDHEAAYGYGYALLEKGDPSAAGPYLCRARPSADVTIQREVAGLIARHGIQCP